jgi:CheY-like chemotaxis protein
MRILGMSVFSRSSLAMSVSLADPTESGMVMPSVLIIEDDEDGRRAVAKLFARADWKVFEAADGDAGVELALRNRPEVILCDLLMPKSNGFQVCRTIRPTAPADEDHRGVGT